MMPLHVSATDPQTIPPILVGPGCTRRDLPAPQGVRVWVVEMVPGAQWPQVDVHNEAGEVVFVIEGELIEGEHRLGPGTYVVFGPHSRHRPRTETGVRLLGFNLLLEKTPS
jgi:hypothetical protein